MIQDSLIVGPNLNNFKSIYYVNKYFSKYRNIYYQACQSFGTFVPLSKVVLKNLVLHWFFNNLWQKPQVG